MEWPELKYSSGVTWPARASWTPTYAPSKERDHVVLHVLRTDQVFAKDRKSSYFHLKSSKTR
jgi:hypothetical protein